MSNSEPPSLAGVRILALFGGAHLFGQERANLEVMRTAKTLGAEVRVILDERDAGGEVEAELRRLAFSSVRADFVVHWHYALRKPRYFFFNLSALLSTARVLRRETREWRPTHFYLMNWNYFASGFFAFRSLPKPLVFRAGDLLPDHSLLHQRLTQRLLRRSQLVVCNSQFLARDMVRLGAPTAKLRVIPNHPPLRKEMADAVQLPTRRGVTLLFVGQIARHKGIALLLDAVGEMLTAGQDLTLWIAGESTWGDPLEHELREVVNQKGFQERILFLGRQSDVPMLLRNCDIHVCPSIVDDPSPNVIVEAKREGVPSVAFSVGGIPELIQHRVDGFLCRAMDGQGLIEGLRHFMEDPKRREMAGQAAHESYERDFGFERFQRQWARVFLDTIRDADR